MNRWIIVAHTAAMSRLDEQRQRAGFSDACRDTGHDDKGAVSTETAVVTALLVAAAMAIVAIIQQAGTEWADSIPGAGG